MKIVNLLRYIKGYIKFNAEGGFTERFINLCAGKSIHIFSSSYENGAFVGETDISNFKRLRPVVRKTGVRITVKEKRGIPFFIKQKKHRVGMLVGVIFYCLFIVVMNVFVWNIDAAGSEKYSSEQLIEAAEKAGVKHGITRFTFDENKAAREIYKLFNGELSWVTVNIKASKCFIEVRDNDKTEKEEIKNKKPSNLVADFDGVILSDETYSGVKSISKGNAVKEGDLLISGVMEDDYGSAIYYSAEGNFTARHNRYFQTELHIDEPFSKINSYSKEYVFHILGLPVRIGYVKEREPSGRFVTDKFLQFDGHVLPFRVSVITVTDNKKISLSQDYLHILAADLFTAQTYSELKNTNLLSGEITQEKGKGFYNIKGEYDCIDFIGISKPIIVENNKSE